MGKTNKKVYETNKNKALKDKEKKKLKRNKKININELDLFIDEEIDGDDIYDEYMI